MAKMQNPQGGGGGGQFARYAGEQVPTVPAGYLESAQAQASLYANLGNTIANMMMKGKELEVQQETNAVAANKNTIADNANKIKEREKDDDAATKYLTARTAASKTLFEMHDLAIQGIDSRITRLELDLQKEGKDALTPEKRAEANAMIKALQEKRLGHQKQVDEITAGMKNLPTTLSEYRAAEQEAARKAEEAKQKELIKVMFNRTWDEFKAPYESTFDTIKSGVMNSPPARLFQNYFSGKSGKA